MSKALDVSQAGRSCRTAPRRSFPTLGRAAFLWGVNEHPFSGYPGLTAKAQIEQIRALGKTSCRVNISSIDHTEALKALIAAGETRGIEILPLRRAA